jgi:hypothetical protein
MPFDISHPLVPVVTGPSLEHSEHSENSVRDKLSLESTGEMPGYAPYGTYLIVTSLNPFHMVIRRPE